MGWHNFQPLIRPRDKKKIPRSGHDRARTGEEHVGEGVAHGTNAKLVTRVMFSEKIDAIETLSALALRVIQPDKCRHHWLPLGRCRSARSLSATACSR